METATKWVIDPTHSELTFKVRHMMISNVKGQFNSYTITAEGEELLKSTFKVAIDTSSIDTHNEERDEHLKSEDFLDVENNKKITFESTAIKKVDENQYKLTGIITIKGIRNEATFDLEYGGTNKDPWGNEKAGMSISGKIDRRDFGLSWNTTLETGGVLVGEQVKIEGELQFAKES